MARRTVFGRRRRVPATTSSSFATLFSMLLLPLLAILYLLPLASAQEEEEVEPSVAVLFPWFSEVMGVIVFFILTRYIPPLPYTAVMFLLGTCMGIGTVRLGLEDYLTSSIRLWDSIDSEVLLLVFLPGLIFSDAFGLNVHLFQVSLWQCVNFAFPMVLAGTCLTAIVGFFIFPFGWSWNLAMTFGSILSATDPVAVSSLLDEVGAPPRLKMHISGESLLNDGSAMVFYNIFSQMFLAEMGEPGVGHVFTVGEGFALFFRMSLGAAAIGVAAGMALIAFLWLLNKRLNDEENVVQVAATITMAYLTYYVADAVCGTSGVIATLTCGVLTRAFGAGMINNMALMENFWSIVEHLLNTLLFALGGVVWGTVIANPPGQPRFSGTEWGYLFLLYVMLHAYRFFLIFANYPITVRIGLSTNWQEAIFSSYGGLRGAVGISLAIAIDNLVWTSTTQPAYREMTRTLFGMIGGVAFLTLVINGSTAGPILKKLGLADLPEVRKKITDRYIRRFREFMIDEYVDGLSDPRFHNVDYALVRHHVHQVGDITLDELKEAVERQKVRVPPEIYRAPCLERTVPYLTNESSSRDLEADPDLSWTKDIIAKARREEDVLKGKVADVNLHVDEIPALQQSVGESDETKELRSIFCQVLMYGYDVQAKNGEIDVREGFVAYVLEEGLEFASDNANRKKPLNDWEMSEVVMRPWSARLSRSCDQTRKKLKIKKPRSKKKIEILPRSFEALRHDVHRALAFVKAHKVAEERFMTEFCSDASEGLSDPEKLVLLESRAEIAKAMAVLQGEDHEQKKDIEIIKSHLLCMKLLNKAVEYVEDLAEGGMLKAQEASGHVEDIAQQLVELSKCSKREHPGELDLGVDKDDGDKLAEGEVEKGGEGSEASTDEPKEEAPLVNEGEKSA